VADIEGRLTRRTRGGVDSFSSITIISDQLRRALNLQLQSPQSQVLAVGGEKLIVLGRTEIVVSMNAKSVRVCAYVIPEMVLPEIEILLGHDVHDKLGTGMVWNFATNDIKYVGATSERAVAHKQEYVKEEEKILTVDSPVGHHGPEGPPNLLIDEPDFTLTRTHGSNHRWVVSNKWIDDAPPPSNMSEFSRCDSVYYKKKWITEDKLSDLVSDWIKNDILRPISQSEVKFIIPLNPVKGATTKSTKIRLAMDYSDLNQFLVSTTSVETNEDCLQQLRLWRLRGNGAVIDLSKAYLSIDLDEQQWPYHCVKFRGNFYCMTRLAFGVANGPRVLFRALEKILKDHDLLVYRDDLLVDDAVVAEIESILFQNGFNTKPPEKIGPGAETAGGQTVRALGLSVKANEWRRTEQNTDDWRLSTEYDDKELTFSAMAGWIATLTAVAPVQSWLRPIGVILKSRIGKLVQLEDEKLTIKQKWQRFVTDEEILFLYKHVRQRLRNGDNPMHGAWAVPKTGDWELHTDASSLIQGGLLIRNGVIIEDFANKAPEHVHINVKELNALITGIQLLLRYRPGRGDRCNIYCDNHSVVCWVTATFKKTPIRSKAMYAELIKTRLLIIQEMIDSTGLDLTIRYVKSSENKADSLTRVDSKHGKKADTQAQSVVGGIWTRTISHSPIPSSQWWWVEQGDTKDVSTLLRKSHEEMLHPSVNQLYWVIKKAFPDLECSDLRKMIMSMTASCDICAKKVAKREPWVGHGKSFEAKAIGEVIFLDSFKIDGMSFTNIIDGYSKYVVPVSIQGSANAETTRQALLTWVAMFGIPRVVRCDRGSEHNSLQQLADEYHFQLRQGSVQHPQSQGVVERFHRTILSLIRCQEQSNIRVTDKYLKGLYVYLRRPHASLNGRSPLEVVTEQIDVISEGRGIDMEEETNEDDERFIDEEVETAESSYTPRFEIDEVILWYDRDQKKSKFPWRRGKVVEAFDKGAYLVRFEDTNRTRTVNEESMVGDPSAIARIPQQVSPGNDIQPLDALPVTNEEGTTNVGTNDGLSLEEQGQRTRNPLMNPETSQDLEIHQTSEPNGPQAEDTESPRTVLPPSNTEPSNQSPPQEPTIESHRSRCGRNTRPPRRYGHDD